MILVEPKAHVRMHIPEQVMSVRLAQSEQMREFFIQMWIQNPALAKQGGSKVQNLLTLLVVTNAAFYPNTPTGLRADVEGGEK